MSDALKSAPSLKRLGRVQRKKVQLGTVDASLVKVESLRPGERFPVKFQPTLDGLDPVSWATDNRELIERKLNEHGAILFRGFENSGLEGFQRFVRAVSGDLLEYTYRSTPRTEVSGRVYTSTEYPAHQSIPQHNEEAYARVWPMKLFFYCETAAEEGGMTPIADSQQVCERIRPELRQRFEEKKVMYVRNYGAGIDLPWQEVFQTEERSEVEKFCRDAGIEFEWREGQRLRTRQICQAVATHPRTGKEVWFNQAHLFHVSGLEPDVREALLEICAQEDLPRNAYYGDGSPIADADLDEIRAVYDREQVAFPWREGDILLLDNMAASHGRTPFKGKRKVRVAMTEPMEAAGLGL